MPGGHMSLAHMSAAMNRTDSRSHSASSLLAGPGERRLERISSLKSEKARKELRAESLRFMQQRMETRHADSNTLEARKSKAFGENYPGLPLQRERSQRSQGSKSPLPNATFDLGSEASDALLDDPSYAYNFVPEASSKRITPTFSHEPVVSRPSLAFENTRYQPRAQRSATLNPRLLKAYEDGTMNVQDDSRFEGARPERRKFSTGLPWQNAIAEESPDIEEVTYEMSSRGSEGGRMNRVKDASDTNGPFGFVATDWFPLIVGVIIALDCLMLVAQQRNPEAAPFIWPFEQFCLCFYIVELTCRILHWGWHKFFCTDESIIWNRLDTIIVVAGVTDQWILPGLHVNEQSSHISPFILLMRGLRNLRLLRILRLGRLVQDADLSFVDSPWFQSFIGFVIALNALVIGLETDYSWKGWFWVEQIFLIVFTFEVTARLKKDGLREFFAASPDITWNWLDFIIVSSGICDQWLMPFLAQIKGGAENEGENQMGQTMMLMRMLRLLRILRLLRLVKSVRPLYIMAIGVLEGMQGVFWVLMLICIMLYAFAILATRLIGKGQLWRDPDRIPDSVTGMFGSIPQSMFMLFKIMNGDQTDLDELFIVRPELKAVFVVFMVLSSWALLSILTTVVNEGMLRITQEQRMEDLNKEQSERSRLELTKLFTIMDEDGSGGISRAEFQEFLSDDACASELRDVIGLKPREAWWVFESMHGHSKQGDIEIEDFIDGLQHQSQPASKISVMHIDGRLQNLDDRFSRLENSVQELLSHLRSKESQHTHQEEAKPSNLVIHKSVENTPTSSHDGTGSMLFAARLSMPKATKITENETEFLSPCFDMPPGGGTEDFSKVNNAEAKDASTIERGSVADDCHRLQPKAFNSEPTKTCAPGSSWKGYSHNVQTTEQESSETTLRAKEAKQEMPEPEEEEPEPQAQNEISKYKKSESPLGGAAESPAIDPSFLDPAPMMATMHEVLRMQSILMQKLLDQDTGGAASSGLSGEGKPDGQTQLRLLEV